MMITLPIITLATNDVNQYSSIRTRRSSGAYYIYLYSLKNLLDEMHVLQGELQLGNVLKVRGEVGRAERHL